MNTHLIKVYRLNGDTFTTKINGSPQEIAEYYQNINKEIFYSNELKNDTQIKEIEYLESEVLRNASSYSYLFIDYDETGLYQ